MWGIFLWGETYTNTHQYVKGKFITGFGICQTDKLMSSHLFNNKVIASEPNGESIDHYFHLRKFQHSL